MLSRWLWVLLCSCPVMGGNHSVLQVTHHLHFPLSFGFYSKRCLSVVGWGVIGMSRDVFLYCSFYYHTMLPFVRLWCVSMGWNLRRRPLSALYCYHPDTSLSSFSRWWINKERDECILQAYLLKGETGGNFKGLQMFERSMPFWNKHRLRHSALHHSSTHRNSPHQTQHQLTVNGPNLNFP